MQNKLTPIDRLDLIKSPSCGHNCKRLCCCYSCSRYKGHYKPNERDAFNEEENRAIDSKWNNEAGFLSDSGCRLPRKLRSIECLAYYCDIAQREMING